jgi:hypothetical protein
MQRCDAAGCARERPRGRQLSASCAQQVYAAPGQWSWPLNLPLSLLGLFPRKLTGTLDDGVLRGGQPAPWADELEHSLLTLPLGLVRQCLRSLLRGLAHLTCAALAVQGPFVECVFFHKASKTLLVTDVVIAVPKEPPQARALICAVACCTLR